MEKINCLYCKNEFHRHLSRRAKFCSNECVSEFKKRKIKADLKNQSPEMCYWMGFLFGDGSVNEKHYKLQVCLSIKDVKLLQQLSHFLFEEDYVNIYEHKCHLQCSSFILYDILKNFGIIPKKTYESILILPQNNKKDFIRGYFDADGWYFNKQYKHINGKYYDKQCWGICSYLPENLEIINNELPHKGSITKKKKQELYELKFQSKTKIQDIRGYLDGTPRLDRKWI